MPPQSVAPVHHWSYFKPKFSGKPQEDPETHICRTVDWMDTHHFVMGQRLQRFPLTLAGEVRLWYQSIHPFQGNWEELQDRLWTQFSNIGNTREVCFMYKDPLHFKENAETNDAYVYMIRQMASMLTYDEPLILEVF